MGAGGPLVAAIDVGTGSVRAHVVAPDGAVVAHASRTHQVRLGAVTAEVDPEEIWALVTAALRDAVAAVDPRRIAAVAVSSALGYVVVDGAARPVGPAILYMDRRASAEAHALGARGGPERLYRLSGRRVDPEIFAAKLMWLRENQPERWTRIATFGGLKDDVVRRLTGVFGSDPTHAAYTMLYDVERRAWSDELRDHAGVPRTLLPPLRRADEIAGRVHDGAARATGLLAGTPVAVGTSDGTAACLAAHAGTAVNVSGSTDVVMAVSAHPLVDPAQRTLVNPHPVNDGWLVGAVLGTTGAALAWLVALTYGDVPEAERYQHVDADAAAASPGSSGLVCLPHLTGARAPRWNAAARGVLCGLDLRHGRRDLVRSLFEGVAMDVAEVLDALGAQGAAVQRIRVVGGGAASDVWNRIRADVTGLPIERPRHTEGTVTGTAYLAARAVGLLPVDVGAEALAPIERSWAPDASGHATYRVIRDARDAIYRAVEPLFDTLAGFRAVPRGT